MSNKIKKRNNWFLEFVAILLCLQSYGQNYEAISLENYDSKIEHSEIETIGYKIDESEYANLSRIEKIKYRSRTKESKNRKYLNGNQIVQTCKLQMNMKKQYFL